jgi:hypothetical protein
MSSVGRKKTRKPSQEHMDTAAGALGTRITVITQQQRPPARPFMSSLGRKKTRKPSQVVAMMGKMALSTQRVVKRLTIIMQLSPDTCTAAAAEVTHMCYGVECCLSSSSSAG